LDREATLNNEMDRQCKEYWTSTKNDEQVWFQETWSIWMADRKISSYMTKEIKHHCSVVRVETYWQGKLGVQMNNVDWQGTEHGMKAIPRRRQQWITKHSSGFCSVGKMAQRIGLRSTDTCPRCQEPETAEHVWKCQHPDANQLWEESLQQLQRTLGRHHTPLTTIATIVQGLQGWRNGNDVVFNVRTTSGQAGIQQQELGWRQFFEGRPHKVWRQIQAQHCEQAGIRQSGKQWVSALITKLLEIAWDLWEHRNGILHDKSLGYEAQVTEEKITEIWQHPRLHCINSIKQLVRCSAEELRGRSLQQKQQWVVRIEAALQRDKRTTNVTKYQKECEGMRLYLARVKK
jgi:hypothetical protein